MELDSSAASNINLETDSSARFLVDFRPQNRPYREHDALLHACADHPGNVADFDTEAVNPYFVEIQTSGFLSSLIGKKKVPASSIVSKKAANVQAPSAVSQEKPSAATGAGEEAQGTGDSKKKSQDAKRNAKNEEIIAQRQERVERTNRALNRQLKAQEDDRLQRQREGRAYETAKNQAANIRHSRNPVLAKKPFSSKRR
jgi:hypothetical protein